MNTSWVMLTIFFSTGEHMQDHPILCQSFEVADGVMSGDVMRDPNLVQAVVAQYQASGEGPLGQSLISSAYVPSMCGLSLPGSVRSSLLTLTVLQWLALLACLTPRLASSS